MAKKPGEQREKQEIKSIQFNSWEFVKDTDKARGLIENMIKMGAPIVSRSGIMSYLVYDLVGIHTNPATIRNLRATLDETSTYYVKRQVPYLDPDGNPILDPETKRPIRKYAPVVERVPGPVLECAFGLLDKGLFELKGTLPHPIINKDGDFTMLNGLTWKERKRKETKVKVPVINLYDGYDPVSGNFFAIPERVMEELKDFENRVPTAEEVKAAVDFIKWFFCDFTFETPSGFASAVAFMLTMLCREYIGGASVPVFEVKAAEPQSGKTLIVKMMIAAITGEIKIIPLSADFKEGESFDKKFFAELLEGRNYMFIDNIKTKIDSALLEMAATTGIVKDRSLGESKNIAVYCGMPIIMTANNPTMSEDMKNRVCLLSILKPPDDKEFVHERQEEEAAELCPPMLKALFVLILNWTKNCNCKVWKKKKLGPYPKWSGIIGGILDGAGITGFLDDTLKQLKEIEPWKEQAAEMAHAWYEKHGEEYRTASTVFDLAVTAGYVKADDTDQSKRSKIGGVLKRLRKVKLPGGLWFEKNPDEKLRVSEWRVVKYGATDS